MLNELIQSLLDYAWDKHIGFTLTNKMNNHGDSVSFAEYRTMIINMNWWRKKEIPLIIAHEISHILNEDEHANYYAGLNTYNIKREKLANIRAVKILVPIYLELIGNEYNCNNVYPLMEQLCIPMGLEKEVSEIVLKSLWYK